LKKYLFLYCTLLFINCRPQQPNLNRQMSKKNRDKSYPTFFAIGTEPFWNFYIHQDTFLFTYLNQEIDTISYYLIDFLKDSNTFDFQLIDKNDTTKRKRLQIIKSTSSCTDGMSDNIYKYHAKFDSLKGCAKIIE
jgi:uncharacterized membrane protein